jgi:hypothetical protein
MASRVPRELTSRHDERYAVLTVRVRDSGGESRLGRLRQGRCDACGLAGGVLLSRGCLASVDG